MKKVSRLLCIKIFYKERFKLMSSILQCTPDYAYGAGGFPAWGIQPNSVLVFEIEVLGAQ